MKLTRVWPEGADSASPTTNRPQVSPPNVAAAPTPVTAPVAAPQRSPVKTSDARVEEDSYAEDPFEKEMIDGDVVRAVVPTGAKEKAVVPEDVRRKIAEQQYYYLSILAALRIVIMHLVPIFYLIPT